MFQSLMDQGKGSDYDPATKVVLFADTKEDVKFSFTPWKQISEREPDELDRQNYWVKLTLVPEELGDHPTPVFQQLSADGVWSQLVRNIGTLHGHVECIGESVRNHFAKVDDSLHAFEYKLSLLKTLLGDCSDAQGTLSVFMLLEDLASHAPSGTPTPIQVKAPDIGKTQEFKDLGMVVQGLDLEFKRFKATITGTVYGEIKNSFDQTFFHPHCAFQTNLAQPTIGFLRTWSSSLGTPADKLSAALRQVDSRLQNLDQAVQRLSSGVPHATSMHSSSATVFPPNAPGFGWGSSLPGGAGGSGTPFGHAALPAVGHVAVPSTIESELREGLRMANEAIEAGHPGPAQGGLRRHRDGDIQVQGRVHDVAHYAQRRRFRLFVCRRRLVSFTLYLRRA
ncbi:hypothetical protein ACA910_017109 [Epithemia clementina (nom. ined.)]